VPTNDAFFASPLDLLKVNIILNFRKFTDSVSNDFTDTFSNDPADIIFEVHDISDDVTFALDLVTTY